MDLGMLKPRDTLRNWSDCGPNLRCNDMIGFHATEIVGQFKIHQELNFRLECHGKCKIDAKGGQLRRAKAEMAAKKMLRPFGSWSNIFKMTMRGGSKLVTG